MKSKQQKQAKKAVKKCKCKRTAFIPKGFIFTIEVVDVVCLDCGKIIEEQHL